jgi:hypothetical protein
MNNTSQTTDTKRVNPYCLGYACHKGETFVQAWLNENDDEVWTCTSCNYSARAPVRTIKQFALAVTPTDG